MKLALGNSQGAIYEFVSTISDGRLKLRMREMPVKGISLQRLTHVHEIDPTLVSAFNPTDVVSELTNILGGAGLGAVSVSFEDFHGTSSGYRHANLSHWFHFPFPADVETTMRWLNLRGKLGTAWDYIVILGDPHTMEKLLGFYALEVSEIAKEMAKGSAETVLFMPSPAADSPSTLNHYKEVVYRVGHTDKLLLQA